MSLRLIHSAKESSHPDAARVPLNVLKTCLLAIGVFFALKLPLAFVANNPEELRDYDHYVRTSQGEYAYRDFVWIYGPAAPILYGTYLKIFPKSLISVRMFTLGLWCLCVLGIALIFCRYYTSIPDILLGTFFATGIIGYPSYSHNHILATLASIFAVYYYLRYQEEGSDEDLSRSFGFVVLAFFTRPVLMGYGLMAAWWGLFFLDPRIFRKTNRALIYGGSLVAVFAVGLLIFGKGMINAFAPLPWTILEFKGYPNLHYLVPSFGSDQNFVTSTVRSLRGALETFVFYGHYFMWPTFLITLVSILKNRTDYKAAAVCAGAGLVCSADLLHYGFSDPIAEPAMFGRGQYFFALTAVSLFLILWRPPEAETTSLKRLVSKFVLLAVGLWAYLPLFSGINQLSRYTMNEFDFPAMRGIMTHPERRSLFEAVSIINSKCDPAKDTVVVSEYDPGLGQLLKCPDLFGRDAYLFARRNYVFQAGENPYAPEGGVSTNDLVNKMVETHQPRFIIMQGASPFLKYCTMPGWQKKVLGEGAFERALCWKE